MEIYDSKYSRFFSLFQQIEINTEIPDATIVDLPLLQVD